MSHAVRRALLVALVFVCVLPTAATVARSGPNSRHSAIRGGDVDRTSVHLTATYDASLKLDWSAGTIRVRSEMRVTNTSGGPIDRVELNTVAPALGNMKLLETTVDGRSAKVNVGEQTLTVHLGGVLPKGAKATVLIRYDARLRDGSSGRSWMFSRDNGIRSVHRWIPWVSRKRSFFDAAAGDPFFTALSPRVDVEITADRPLIYASTGSPSGGKGNTRRFHAVNVRDFNFTAAPDYGRLTGWSRDGETKIVVFSRTFPRPVVLQAAKDAIAIFEKKLGQYPYPRLTISEASGGSGMESPGHVWISRTYPHYLLRFLTVHEVGHQWFYGVVGSDQPRQPFADEAVTDFLTRWYLGAFRSSQCSQARLDGSVYDYSGSCLHEVIYIQGGNFLDKLRHDIGNTRFWNALRDYYQNHRWQFGTTYELLERLRKSANAAGVNVMPRYRHRFPTIY